MSKKLILLFIICFVLLAFIVAIHKYATDIIPSSLKFSRTVKNKSIPTPVGDHTLSLLPNQLIAPPGKPTSMHVHISSVGTPATLVQLEIAYDPVLLTDMTVAPGDFFANPTILLQSINENTGRISYAIEKSSAQNWTQTEGTVVTLHFTPRPGMYQKETSLSFLPKTLIRSQGETLPLKATTGATIHIQATPSALMR